jgi:hypothetical protein
MKERIIPLLIGAILTILALLVPLIYKNPTSTQKTFQEAISGVQDTKKDPPQYGIPEETDPKVVRILTDLIRCESRGNPNALNKIDRDGTPSYGLLQFKPSTFHAVLKQYIDPTITEEQSFAKIYDGDLQIKAFIAWFGDGRPISWWQQQFPACSKLYGYWIESNNFSTEL